MQSNLPNIRKGETMIRIYCIALLILSGLSSLPAEALPIMNRNSPGAEMITVLPDHLDPNLYYLAPTVLVTARHETGIPQFSYHEYKVDGDKHALVQTTMRPAFDEALIRETKARIQGLNPLARFTALPFIETKVVFGETAVALISKSSCDHQAGLIGDEQSCSFTLNDTGIRVLRPSFKRGTTLVMQMQYAVMGVIQIADGSYHDKKAVYEMAGRIGGPELAGFPQLFRDRKGRIIKD
jgi:hypothetical protein